MTEGHTPDLIERIERATGPCRALDGDISALLSLQPQWATNRHERQPELFSDDGPGLRAKTWLAPKFTGSIDAAVTLVPDGFEWAYLDNRAIVRIPGSLTHEMGEGATPALALCAASLKARAIP